MAIGLLHAPIAVGHAYLLHSSKHLLSENLQAVLFQLVVAGLVYDNIVLTIGRFLGPGPVLKALSYPRFVLHEIFAPLLFVPVAYPIAVSGYWRFAFVLNGLGALLSIWGLQRTVANWMRLTPAKDGDGVVIRYTRVHERGTKQWDLVAVILLTVLTIVVGGILWYTTGAGKMCLGAISMFLIAGAIPPTTEFGGLMSNLGEFLMCMGILSAMADAQVLRPL